MSDIRKHKEKKSFLIFKKNSDLQTVSLVTVAFVIAVVIYQLISGVSKNGVVAFPSLLYPSNILNILIQATPVGILALGMTAVMLAGGIDLSVGMMTSMFSMFVAKVVMHGGMHIGWALLLGIMICITLEIIMGAIISVLNVESFIITLGGQIACRGIGLLITRSQEVAMDKQHLGWLKENLFDLINPEGIKIFSRKLQLPYYVLIFVALTIITWALLKYTRFGRRIYAVGNNPQAAYLSGINVRSTKLLVYIFNGLCVGIGATTLLTRVGTGIITVGQNLEIDVIAAVVIGGVAMSGGKGSVMGAFIGSILMFTISNAMTLMGIQSEWQYVVKGLIIIISVAGGALSHLFSTRKAVRQQKAAL